MRIVYHTYLRTYISYVCTITRYVSHFPSCHFRPLSLRLFCRPVVPSSRRPVASHRCVRPLPLAPSFLSPASFLFFIVPNLIRYLRYSPPSVFVSVDARALSLLVSVVACFRSLSVAVSARFFQTFVSGKIILLSFLFKFLLIAPARCPSPSSLSSACFPWPSPVAPRRCT